MDGTTIAMIGEKGREAVLPLENNTGWMRDMARELAAEMAGSFGTANSGNLELVLEVGHREFGRAVVELGDKERKRMGVRIQPRAVLG